MGEDTSDLADGFSKYRVELKALTGVDIQKNNNEYKDMLTIFTELAAVWDDLESDMARARVAEILGGTRNQSGIMSTIQNIKDAMGAYDDAMNSAGTAIEANNKHMETTEAHIAQLKASFQELSADVFNSSFMQGAVDALKTVVDIIDSIAERFGTLTAVLAVGGTVGSFATAIKSITTAISKLSEAGKSFTFIDVMTKAFPGITSAITAFKTAVTGASGAGAIFKAAWAGISTLVSAHPFLAAATGIAVLIAAFSGISSAFKSSNEKMQESVSAYEEAKEKVSSIKTELDSINSQIDAFEIKGTSLTFVEQGQLQDLREAKEILESTLYTAQQLETASAKEAASSIVDSFKDDFEEDISEETYKNAKDLFDIGSNQPYHLKSFDEDNDIASMIAGIEYLKEFDAERYADSIDSYTGKIWEKVSKLEEYRATLSSIPSNLRTHEQSEILEEIGNSIDFVYQKLAPEQWNEMKFERIFDDTALLNIRNGLVQIAKESDNAGVSLETLSDVLTPEQYNAMESALKDVGFTMTDLINHVNSEAGIIDIDAVTDNVVERYHKLREQQKQKIEEEASDDSDHAKTTISVDAEIEEGEFDFEEWFNSLDDATKLVVNQLQTDGTIDVSGWGLADYQEYIDQLTASAEDASEAAAGLTGELTDLDILFANDSSYKTELDSYTNSLNTLADAQQKIKDGSFSMSDMIDLQQTPGFSALAEYDMSNISEGIDSLMDSIIGKSDEASLKLLEFRDSSDELSNAFDDIQNLSKSTFEDIFDFETGAGNVNAMTKAVSQYSDQVMKIMNAGAKAGLVDLSNQDSVKSYIDLLYDSGIIQGQLNEEILEGTGLWGLYDRMVAAVGGDTEKSGAALKTMFANMVAGFKDVGEAVETVTVDELVNNYQNAFSKVQGIVQSQTTGKSISAADFSSDDLSDYTKALEYHNGVLRYNAEMVAEISEAKAEETKRTIAANKAAEQVKYLENAGQIEKLRASLANASDTERSAIESTIQSLLDENSQIVDTCNKYNLMTNSINEATSAYQNWLNAQNATQSGAMFDSALGAMGKIDDTLNNESSDSYGRIGNEDYKAAIDFLVPDSVDHSDTEAVSAYMDSLSDILIFDDNGSAKGLNIEAFCEKAVEQGLMVFDEASEEYQVAGQKTMEDFAEGLNYSLPLIQAIFGEMEEFGGHFSWADELEKTYGDLGVEANEAAEALRNMEGHEDMKIVLDVSEFEDSATAIETLDGTIEQMNELKASPDVDTSEIEYANSIIEYCIAQKQLLTAPAVMTVDTSQVTGELGNALALLQEFVTTKNQVEMQAAIGADTTEAQAQLDGLVAEIQGISPEIQTDLGLKSASVDSITASIEALTPEMIVKAGVDPSLVDEYIASEHNSEGTVTWNNNSSLVDSYAASQKRGSGTVYWSNNTSAVKTYFTATGTVKWTNASYKVNGTANAGGTARMHGDWGMKQGGTTLVGELG